MNTAPAAEQSLGDLTMPALSLLAQAIDREFERRGPHRPGHVDFAAARLGLEVTDIAVVSEEIEPPVAHAVGHWLYETQKRYATACVGADPWSPAATTRVQGAAGDVRAFRAATVVIPAGVVHASHVVMRLAPHQYGFDVELLGARDTADDLAEALASFLRTRKASDSPYRMGAYRVTCDNRGLMLSRWTPPAASRELLKLDDSVWTTIDRSVHRVLALADDLKARGLGTSTGVLLVGPPGTGKTQLGTVVATELAGSVTVLIPGSYVTEHFLTELFDIAADLSPSLILIDDLDLIAGERGNTNPHRLREFLNVMDGGLADRVGVVVLASTNDHRKIDKAARRSSRFDTVVRLDAPPLEGRLAILRRYLSWADDSLNLEAVARATDGATGADLKELVRRTVLVTDDHVTTQALLAEAETGSWRADTVPAGVYL